MKDDSLFTEQDALAARCRAAVNACEAQRMPATAKLLQEAAEALAAPAASVDVKSLVAEYSEYFDTVRLPHQVQELWDRLRALIDSAGGAKGITGSVSPQMRDANACTPQPAEGDGAVASAYEGVCPDCDNLDCDCDDTCTVIIP